MEGSLNPMSLLELLTRTRLQEFTYKQGTLANMAYPDGAGSGFFLRHEDKVILVTADHVCHPFDHEPNVKQRAFVDKDVAIVNNWVEKDANGVDVPILTPVGGFYYFDQFKFTQVAGFEDFRPFDATFSIFSAAHFQKPFRNEGIIVKDGPTVEAGLDMIAIPSEAIVEPSSDDWYICFGHTNFGLNEDGVHLKWDTTIHEKMKYTSENGDYYVFTPAEPIDGKASHGISGAPVLNQTSGLLGILCGGDPAHSAIYVMSIKKVMSLINPTLQIEETETLNKK